MQLNGNGLSLKMEKGSHEVITIMLEQVRKHVRKYVRTRLRLTDSWRQIAPAESFHRTQQNHSAESMKDTEPAPETAQQDHFYSVIY